MSATLPKRSTNRGLSSHGRWPREVVVCRAKWALPWRRSPRPSSPPSRRRRLLRRADDCRGRGGRVGGGCAARPADVDLILPLAVRRHQGSPPPSAPSARDPPLPLLPSHRRDAPLTNHSPLPQARTPAHAVLLVAHVESEDEALEVARRAADAQLDGIDLNADADVCMYVWNHSSSHRGEHVLKSSTASTSTQTRTNAPLVSWRRKKNQRQRGRIDLRRKRGAKKNTRPAHLHTAGSDLNADADAGALSRKRGARETFRDARAAQPHGRV